MITNRSLQRSFALAITLVAVGFLATNYLIPAVRQEPWSSLLLWVIEPAFPFGVILFVVSFIYWAALKVIPLLRRNRA